jgi:hypothetical protein
VALPVNQPQVRVTIDGIAVPGVILLEIERVAYFSADRFTATFALGAVAAFGRSYFSSIGGKIVTIEASDQQYGFVQLLIGQVDNILDDLKSSTVTISGRDLSARLIDTEISETFANQTSSQVASTICSRHGLTANVTSTSTPIGQYYDLDHARSALGLNSRGGTEWNLLSWLAMIEGFSLSVFGLTLNFGLPLSSQPYILTPQGCLALEIDVASALPTTSTVKSWNTRNKTAIVQTSGNNTGTVATLIRPNLTNEFAAKMAQNHLAVLNTHGTLLLAAMPGELSIVPGRTLNLTGTDSQYDQDYLVDTVSRSISAVHGFTQNVKAHAVS